MDFPPNIPGINYKLITEYNIITTIYDDIIKTINKNITDKDITDKDITDKDITDKNIINKNITDNITRIEPPYNIPCAHLKISNCQKMAGFIVNKDEYYCWYHMHCN